MRDRVNETVGSIVTVSYDVMGWDVDTALQVDKGGRAAGLRNVGVRLGRGPASGPQGTYLFRLRCGSKSGWISASDLQCEMNPQSIERCFCFHSGIANWSLLSTTCVSGMTNNSQMWNQP